MAAKYQSAWGRQNALRIIPVLFGLASVSWQAHAQEYHVIIPIENFSGSGGPVYFHDRSVGTSTKEEFIGIFSRILYQYGCAPSIVSVNDGDGPSEGHYEVTASC